MTDKKTFEATAMGDVIHFEASNQAEADQMLTAMCGHLPSGMVTWKELDSLPDGAEYAADMRGLA